MKSIPASEIAGYFHGHLGVLNTPQGVCPFRMRNEDMPWIPSLLVGPASKASGTRLSFITTTRKITLKMAITLHTSAETGRPEGKFDLFVNGEMVESQQPENGENQILNFQELPAGEKLVEIYLPQYTTFFLQELILGEDSDTITPYQDSRPRWLTYGSSITQCAGANRPSQTWPALVARHFNWNLTSMGYGGQCHFDQIVARTIADQKVDRISCCLGVNTVSGTFSPRTWQPAVEGFIFTIRDKHPNTPLLIISPIAAPNREYNLAENSHMGLIPMRRMLEESFQKFRAAGDRNIYFLNGLEILNVEEAHEYLLSDLVHPGGKGYEYMARKFIERVPTEWSGQAQEG